MYPDPALLWPFALGAGTTLVPEALRDIEEVREMRDPDDQRVPTRTVANHLENQLRTETERELDADTVDPHIARRTPTKARKSHTLLTGGLRIVITVAVLVILLGVVGWQLLTRVGLPSIFSESIVTRTSPVVLQAVRDLAHFEAAAGSFMVVVDSQKQRELFNLVPVNEGRIVWVGSGNVSAYVDLSQLTEEEITVSEDRRTVSMRLPHARLGNVALDLNPERSYFILDGTGTIWDRNPTGEAYLSVLRITEAEIAEAAVDTELLQRAEDNTRIRLDGMLRALGFEQVELSFA